MSMEAVEAPVSEESSEQASEATVDNIGDNESYNDLLSAYDAIVSQNQQPDDDEFDGTGDDAADVAADEDSEESVESVQDWNWREFASNQIPVKIDGQEMNVPLEELRNGYMRQADYTRKTQEVSELQKLAEWAQEFQDRFKQDPQGMVRMLASAVGFDGPQQRQPDPLEDLVAADPELAPLAQTIRQQQDMISELREELAALGGKTVETQSEIQFQKNVELVRKEIEQVKSRFEDFDEMQILPIAAQTGLDLTASYFLWKGSQSAQAPAVQPQAEPQPAKKANAAKKQVAQSVTNSRFAGEPSTDGEQYDSFAELFEIVARTEGQ